MGAKSSSSINTTIGHRFVARGKETDFEHRFASQKQHQTVTFNAGETPVDDRLKGKPNVLFLMADDWSWPHAGALGDEFVKTPTFDRIAREGVLFENAHVCAPSCTPSRFAIATGQYHWRLREGAKLGGSIRQGVPTYPELLQRAGYRAGFARKGAAPSRHEFTGRDPFGARVDSFEAFIEDLPDGRPFCFWYGAGEPHRPYAQGTGEKTGMNPDDVHPPACLPDNETVRSDVCDYYERVQSFDTTAGRMLALLAKKGLLENTIVVISGDNGMPFPRCKATLYDMGTRVPLAIRWGKEIERPGRTVTDFVTLCDIGPTVLASAGLSVPPVMTGRSLLPQLRSEKSGRIDPSRDHVLTGIEQHVFLTPCRAIRTDDFLYIRNFDPENWPTGRGDGPPPTFDFTEKHWPSGADAFSFNCDPSPSKQYMQQHATDPKVAPLYKLAFGRRPAEELYDLKKDPDQLDNVAGQAEYQTSRERLRGRLDAELRRSGDPRIVAEMTAVRPNVLFISVDDLNDWTGCLGGHPQAKTPNMDRLAESGVLFSEAYCAGASCNPSRTALMTGLPPYRSGLYDNRQKMREILPDAETIPAYFARHGYWSCGSGKILHYFIDARSWDEYYPKKETENPFPPTYLKNRDGRPFNLPHEPWMYVETDWCGFDVSDDEFKGDALVADWVIRRFTQPPDQPFFLACGIYRPHEPWFVPQKYFELFPLDEVQLPPGVKEDDLDDLPPIGKRIGPNRYLAHIQKHGKWREGVQAYLASIAYADAMVGRVVDALDHSPQKDNTIVVLWSDHGWHLGEKQHWQKFTPWRVCDRVPLMIRVPEGVPGLPEGTASGGRCTRPVNLVDLFKTLNELSGLPEKQGIGGHSLVPLLKNPQASWPHPSITHVGRPQRYAISTERWRYIHYEDGSEELYDIETDPYEWTNLAEKPEHEAKLKELRAMAPKEMRPLENVHF